MIHIFPSLIGGDLLALRDQITSLDAHCAGYHLDVMDGHFVPNITWGPTFINAIAATTKKRVWIHLMVTDPYYWALQLTLPAHSMIDFHIEVPCDHRHILTQLRAVRPWQVGLAINPDTSIEAITPFLALVDYITIMSVQPGFSGQDFIPATLAKITQLAELRAKHHYHYALAIDGGINKEIMSNMVFTEIQYVAIASALFSTHNPIETLKELTHIIQKKEGHR